MPIVLNPDISTTHGVLSRQVGGGGGGVVRVGSGEVVQARTLDAWWGLEPFTEPYGARRVLEHPDRMRGHCLLGPVYVEGLMPGEVLEVRVERLVPASRGFTEAGGVPWPHYSRLGVDSGGPRMLLWDITPSCATTRLSTGPYSVPTAPFLGWMGLAPAEPGEHSTTPPRRTGGNLDLNLLIEGSRLFLPVEVEGGLLSFGDGHAAQGDGELSNNGIECAMEEVRLRLIRRSDLSIRYPVAVTSSHLVAVGLGVSLDEAAGVASNSLLDLICGHLGCARFEALGLASVAGSLRITQIVNGVVGVHATFPLRPEAS